MLSVIIITRNESHHIESCLKSVVWADEIIVLDSGSSDDTVAICKKYTAQVYETDWPGFGPQKQRTLDKAQGDWVLSIDADEQISPELKNEIHLAMQTSDVNGFYMPRLSSYCGKKMKHGGWWPDYVLRLFQRKSGRFTEDLVHERVIIEGTTKKLNNPIQHESYINLEEVLDKVNNYSSLGAEKLFNNGKTTSLSIAVLRGAWTFFRTYFIKRAFLDGAEGLMVSISNAEATYYKYLKLLLIQKKS